MKHSARQLPHREALQNLKGTLRQFRIRIPEIHYNDCPPLCAQALLHIMEGCGEGFTPHITPELRALLLRALLHPNRSVLLYAVQQSVHQEVEELMTCQPSMYMLLIYGAWV